MGNDSSKAKRGAGNTSTSSTSTGIISSLKPGPSSSVVQKHLETAKKSRALSLKATNLKSVPNAIIEVAAVIRTLDLSQNKITTLPAFFGQFEILKQLHLNDNGLTELPDEIGNLKKLEILNVNGNNLDRLPDTLVGCIALTTLNLSGNRFTKMPVTVCLLPSADIIDLSFNAITEIPDEIGQLSAQELNLNHNKLTSLNPHITAAQNLKTLRIESNALSKQAFTKELFEDSQLSLIQFDNNHFQHKDFQDLQGYEKYEERFTANRRKAY